MSEEENQERPSESDGDDCPGTDLASEPEATTTIGDQPPVSTPTYFLQGENPFRRQRHARDDGISGPLRVRENFPSFEAAMGNRSSSPSSTSSSRADDILNQSAASSAGGGSHASSLNLSMGARAALNQHLRHVARFGIDGNGDNSRSNSPLHGTQQQQQITPPRNPLDAQWERLLEETTNVSQPSSSSTSTGSSAHIDGLEQMDTMVTVSSGDLEGSEAIEVSPVAALPAATITPRFQLEFNIPSRSEEQEDTQSRSSKSTASFFNSCRVLQLYTPERNRSGILPAVTLRNTDYLPGSPSILEDSIVEEDSASETMAQMFHALTLGAGDREPSPQLDRSFPSFTVADLSRISGDHSPDHSFQRHSANQQDAPLFAASFEDDQSPWLSQDDNPSFDIPPPPPSRTASHGSPFAVHRHQRHLLRDVSSVSLPVLGRRRSPSPPALSRSRRHFPLKKQYSAPLTNRDINKDRTTTTPGKENTLNRVLSPAAFRAGDIALSTERQHDFQTPPPQHNLVDYFQQRQGGATNASLLHTTITASMDAGDEISTIHNTSSSSGQHNTSSSSSSMGHLHVASKKGLTSVTKATAAAAATPATAILNKSTLSSSSSSSSAAQLHYLDRRRYRTVVPSRVFMKKEPPDGFFPVSRDSFSFDDEGGGGGAGKRSGDADDASALLQHSFEAAYLTSLEETEQIHQQGLDQQQNQDRQDHNKD